MNTKDLSMTTPSLSQLKVKLKSTFPGLWFALRSQRTRQKFRRAHGGAEYRASRALFRAYGRKIYSGPFQGMKYGNDVVCSAYVAKLVGSYEQELHSTIEGVIEKGYDTVVDIGSAEGYYAVGLAWRMRGATVYAYDTDENARYFCASLARRNGVSNRVEQKALCTPNELDSIAQGRVLVFCDCEGGELDVLDPAQAMSLQTSDIIVELHEFIQPGLSDQVLERFRDSHDIKIFDIEPRRLEDYSSLQVVEPADRPWAVREGRPEGMQWAVLLAKHQVTQNRGPV